MIRSQFMLRMDILRDTREQYEAFAKMAATTQAERTLYLLKAAECEAMLLELVDVEVKS